MNHLHITFTGGILDLRVELEGREVGLYFDGVSKWTRTIENFDIKDELNVLMLCKGLNGTDWTMEIQVNDETPHQYNGTIANGFSRITDEISIQE